jgi:hypothetical protein
VLTAAASLAFWLGGLWRLPRAIAEPQKRPLCLALLAFGLGAMFDTDPVYTWFDRSVHVTNFSDLLAHAFGLVGIYFLMTSLDGLVGTPRSKSRWLLPCLTAAVIASAALFFSTPMPRETSAFTAEYGQRSTILAYWMISILFPVLCLVQLSRTVVAHRSSPAATLRRGLKVCGVGVLFGYAYAGLKVAELIAADNGDQPLASTVRPLDRGLLGTGLFLIAVGLGSPSIIAWTRRWRERRRVRKSLRRLEWLWTQFCIEAGAAPVIRDGSPQFQLLRRVVELRDAQAALWSFVSANDLAQIRNELRKAGTEPDAVRLEAAALALALQRELAGVERARHGNEPPVARTGEVGTRALDLDAEVDELAALGAEIRRVLA